MTPVVDGDRSFDRQIGCMAGFLQIFDRHQIIAGKRPYAAKRLYPAAGSTSPSERSEASASSSFVKDSQPPPSPEAYPSSPESRGAPVRPLPVFEFKDAGKSSWKFREAPRLSLDSRAIVDAKGKLRPREIRTPANQSDASDAGDDLENQRRSPSVVARLMGLDALPGGAAAGSGGETGKPAELRRSASESRVPRDLSLFRFVDPSTFQKPPPPKAATMAYRQSELGGRDSKNVTPMRASLAASLQRKSFFDAQDFFPEPKQTGSLYGEIERRLRMRGIDEPAKDLETLKQVLEALQLKGLLHSRMHQHEYQSNAADPPIVVMKMAGKSTRRSSVPTPRPNKSSPPVRRRLAPEAAPPPRVSRHRVETERSPRGRSPRSPDRFEPSRPSTPPARKNIGTPPPQRRSPVHSPRTSPRRVGPDPLAAQSPRNRHSLPDLPPKPRIYSPAVEDDSSTSSTAISESSISNSSHCDFERSRVEDHNAGRSLLERCDKLLHSIAAITSAPSDFTTAEQPSPISVLNASRFLGSDEISPPPAVKRAVVFKDQPLDWDEDRLSPLVGFDHVDGSGGTEENEFAYVSKVVIGLERNVGRSELYASLEKSHQLSRPSELSSLQRRLLFDLVVEIVDRKLEVATWDTFSRAAPAAAGGSSGVELLQQVWAEVWRIREGTLPEEAGDLNAVTCGAIRMDMAAAGDGGWGRASAVEMSNAVLHIERQLFKDLVAEVIRELATEKPRPELPRRKLMF